MTAKTIGVVGGVGPLAGVDLFRKIHDNTRAERDQEHLSVVVISEPSGIEDRTGFLVDGRGDNPGYEIARVIHRLSEAGADVVGIPCNTAHAEPIFSVIRERVGETCANIILADMREDLARLLSAQYPAVQRVGILGTNGTHRFEVHHAALRARGLDVVVPEWEFQRSVVHALIYHPQQGLKSGAPPHSHVVQIPLSRAVQHLVERGAEAIALACTELSLAHEYLRPRSIPIVDTTVALARSLIAHADPDSLKEWGP